MILCLLWGLAAGAPAAAQDPAEELFVGYGIAPIATSLPDARAAALRDAQCKVVLAAVSAQMSIKQITAFPQAFENVFFSRPDAYLREFTIEQDVALQRAYRVTIRGRVNAVLLRNDLAAMGVDNQGDEGVRMLVMLAESLDEGAPRFWWATDTSRTAPILGAQQALSEQLRRRNVLLVVPTSAQAGAMPPELGAQAAPDNQLAAACARVVGARYVLIGRAALRKPVVEQLAGLESAQCNLSVPVVDGRTGETRVQAATHTLGVHIDSGVARQDAVDKACRRIAGQVMDTVYQFDRTFHEYRLRFAFAHALTEADGQAFRQALQDALPQVEILELAPGASPELLTMRIRGALRRAALLQQLFEHTPAGYAFSVHSTDSEWIQLKVNESRS